MPHLQGAGRLTDEGSRLYLLTPPGLADPAAFLPALAAAVGAANVACVEITLAAGLGDDDARSVVDALRAPVHALDVAAVVSGWTELAAQTGCDGAVVDPEGASYRDARAVLGPDAIVGVAAGSSRHDAMSAAERGASFVALDPDPDLIGWWAEIMEVPCVAMAVDDMDAARQCAAAGADFVALRGPIWSHPEGPAAGARAAIDLLSGGEPSGGDT